ncbi:MAG: glycosyltransferase [Trichodesmium sp. St19_bin1]|nr:glycosyltransferase [Trichodesmium sp. St19_bin1]
MICDILEIRSLQGASIFVYPSLYEGCGILLLEAISLDCPIACSYTSSLPDSEQIYMIFCGKTQK